MKTITIAALAGLTISGITTQSHAITITLDVSGMATWGFQGDPANDRLDVFVGSGALLTSILWDLNITTVGISWAEEVSIGFFGNSLTIFPGLGDAFTVTNQNYAGHMAPTNILLGADGILDIEFFESVWDDNLDAIDAYFEEGSTITITIIPTPGPLALLGLGGLTITRRKR
ncbi:hypothetical protein COB72_07600 [bacterium]|nr:MAG: hypothetical protein COB72_07600 [bacterium]